MAHVAPRFRRRNEELIQHALNLKEVYYETHDPKKCKTFLCSEVWSQHLKPGDKVIGFGAPLTVSEVCKEKVRVKGRGTPSYIGAWIGFGQRVLRIDYVKVS